MAYREKLAWVMMIVMTAPGFWYFNRIDFLSGPGGQTPAPNFAIIIGYVALVIIAAIIGSILIAISKPSEADAVLDEREHRILDKAARWGGYVLSTSVFVGLLQYGLNDDGNRLFHIVFGCLMISQIAEFAFQIFLYRRGV